MKNIETQTIINASKADVWEVLMNHADYPIWNPFIQKIEGNIMEGEQIRVEIHPPESSKMTFTPTILRKKTNEEFRWLGHLFIPKLFDGEHYFKITSAGPDKTKLIHGENFSGMLSHILLPMIKTNTIKGFEEMNIALKHHVESQRQKS